MSLAASADKFGLSLLSGIALIAITVGRCHGVEARGVSGDANPVRPFVYDDEITGVIDVHRILPRRIDVVCHAGGVVIHSVPQQY